MSLPTLYELANDYKKALETLGDLDLPEEAVFDTLVGLQGNLEAKAQNVMAFCRNLESVAGAIKDAETKMAHRRKVIENRVASIKEYIKKSMETAGVSKLECPYFKLSIKNNPPRVVIDDEHSLPPEFIRVPQLPPPEPDKKLIGEALKKGEPVPGAHLEKGTRLSID